MELSITFTGPDLAAVQKQAAAFVGFKTPAPTAAPAKTAAKKAAAPIEETEDESTLELPDDVEDSTDFMGEEEIEAPKTKKAAAPKLTEKDVNAVAKAHAGTHGRAATLAILKKQFKVQSILELKPEQYALVIKALK